MIPHATNQMSQTDTERLELAAQLEAKRVERAEYLAAESARTATTLLEHERRLNAINGHINEFIREVNMSKTLMTELGVEFKGLRVDINKMADQQKERDKQTTEDRRSVKAALYALLVTLSGTGAGAILYELLK